MTRYPSGFESTRFLYLPSVFSCSAIAASFMILESNGSRRARPLGAGMALLAVTAWLAQLLWVNQRWARAADTAAWMLETFPTAALGQVSRLCIAGLPDNEHGAYVFREGFPEAVRLFLRADLAIQVLPRAEWERESSAPLAAGQDEGTAYYRWDAAGRVWQAAP